LVKFVATIKRFEKQGEKTGWTYVTIPADIVSQLKPNTRLTFRVKGKLDKFPISEVSILPMGGGDFIMPLNANLRKGIGKRHGATLTLQITEDKAPFKFNADFLECLADEPSASKYFQTLTPSHQRYFSKWIDDAKTLQTRTRRIARAVTALSRGLGYSDMLKNV
jgi:hypothetical protein